MAPSDEFEPAIRRLQKEISDKEREIVGLKKTVNTLCGYAGRSAIYQSLDSERGMDVSQLRRDQFFGVPLATAVKDYLRMRGDPKSGGMGAATVNEIFDALLTGGFHFETKNDENAKRALRISLAKNVVAFTKVPGGGEGAFGLSEWYPAARAPRAYDSGKKAGHEPVEEHDPPEESDASTPFDSNDASESEPEREED